MIVTVVDFLNEEAREMNGDLPATGSRTPRSKDQETLPYGGDLSPELQREVVELNMLLSQLMSAESAFAKTTLLLFATLIVLPSAVAILWLLGLMPLKLASAVTLVVLLAASLSMEAHLHDECEGTFRRFERLARVLIRSGVVLYRRRENGQVQIVASRGKPFNVEPEIELATLSRAWIRECFATDAPRSPGVCRGRSKRLPDDGEPANPARDTPL